MNEPAVDLSREATTPPAGPIGSDRAWVGAEIRTSDWLISLGEAHLAEISNVADALRAQPLPTFVRAVDDFELPALRAALAEARRTLDDGCGFVVLDRLPMDQNDIDDMVTCFWLIGQMLARPVAQKWDGTLIYDVTDTGRKFGYGVRGSATSIELVFHTDNAFGHVVPDYVGLLCKYPAAEGGVSRFCSLYTLHNRLFERDPELLARLYQPVIFDRQAEHAEGAPKVSRAPFFSRSGDRLAARANVALVRKGYKVAGTAPDDRLEAALKLIEEISADPELWYEAPIERGQIQYLNNHEIGHYRSEFRDHADPAKKRHLYRTWHRQTGLRTYDGI